MILLILRIQQKNNENNNTSINFLPNISNLKKEAEEKGTLIFAFSYGSYFGGECEIFIIDNGDERCSVHALG